LQRLILSDALKSAGLTGPDQQLPSAIHVVNGVDRLGKQLHYYFNYSNAPASFTYTHGGGKDLLTDEPVAASQQVTLKPWDLAIVEEP
jgi:beta-galactosidase